MILIYILLIIGTIRGIIDLVEDIKKIIRMKKGYIREDDFDDWIL